MRYKSLFLISLGVNVILGILVFQRSTTPPVNPSREPRSVAQGSIGQSHAVEAVPVKPEGKRFGWESVESPDYKQYIANLRALGCPEETIRDIIEADVMKLYDAKKKQVRKEPPKFEYWKGDGFLRGVGREAWLKMAALDEEQEKVLRELGVEPNYRKRALKQQNGKDWMLDFLSDDKKDEILRMQREFENRLSTRPPNSMDFEGIKRLVDEHEAAIKRLLTPEEAFHYDLRKSPLSMTLRNELSAMDATEAEFIALYKLHVDHEDHGQPLDANATAAERRAAREIEKERNEKLQEQIRQTLGPERYADYQLAQDSTYKLAHAFAQQVGLGSRAMRQVYDIAKEAEQTAFEIQDNSTLAAEKRAEALQAIRQETERAMRGILGESAWEQFNSAGPGLGNWLRSVTRPQAP